MIAERIPRTCLVAAGIASCSMAAFHFLLPHIFGWAHYVNDLPAPIRWGVFSINVFFSCLLLWGGIATIIAAVKYKASDLLNQCIFLGMGSFWVINVSYQVVWPFPVATVRWILLAFAILVGLLYIFAVVLWFNKGAAKARA